MNVTPPPCLDVMAMVSATRNMRAHLNDCGNKAKRQNAAIAANQYHKALQIMLQGFPVCQLQEAQRSVLRGRPLHSVKGRIALLSVTCAISETLLGMNGR